MSKVPAGWVITPISNICESIIDCVNKTAPVVDFKTPYKMIRTTNVRHGRVDTEHVRYVTKDTFDTWTRRGAPQNGDIILTREAPVGEAGILKNADGIFLGQRTIMYRVNKMKANNYFILYSILGNFCQRQIENFSNGGTVAHMRVPDCEEILLKVPPLPEQTKIAQILSTWDKAIATTEKLIGNSQQQKKALMQSLLTGKKRLPGFEGEWIVQPLGNWLKEYKNKSSENDQYEVLTSSRNGLVLQSKYFENNRISSRDNIGFNILPEGYVTYRSRSDDGRFTFNVNKLGIPGLISVYYPVFNFPTGSLEFFINLLSLSESLFEAHSVGTSQKVLSINALKLMKFKIPNVEEQQKIAAVLTAADNEIELLQKKLAFLKQEKAALMQQLLTGKRRVKVEAA
ncbi:restriction endonuclease subunit S [Rahnella aceris]|uniref:restriction endonuclease subunit S n=1 Tax=Rahnella sp. (strain Y9602) TaxID=2703885 RepID=UPI003FD415CF